MLGLEVDWTGRVGRLARRLAKVRSKMRWGGRVPRVPDCVCAVTARCRIFSRGMHEASGTTHVSAKRPHQPFACETGGTGGGALRRVQPYRVPAAQTTSLIVIPRDHMYIMMCERDTRQCSPW